jgi:hypothetical protein
MNKVRIAGIAVGVALLFGGGMAVASIPESNGTIHGCYKTSDGKLRVIDSNATCSSGETPLNWSQTGPKGDAGEPGPAGEDGVSGYEQVTGQTANAIFGGSGGQYVIKGECPEGKVVTGGGYSIGGNEATKVAISDQFLIYAAPSGDRHWEVDFTVAPDGDSATVPFTAYAVCVNA